MRKIIQKILMVVALFATTISFAQTYNISPNDTLIVNGLMEDLETLTIQQINATTDTLYLKWKKISESVPANWEASVCDNQFCYLALMDSGMMNPVFQGEYGFLLIHCTAHVNFGTAVIRYAIWDKNFPRLKDTLTFIINVTTTAIIGANPEAPSVWFAENRMHLKNNNGDYETLRLIDLSGKEIFQIKINGETEFALPTIPTSIYVIQLGGKYKQFQQKIFYQQ